MVVFKRPNIVLIHRERTTFVMAIAVLFTHSLPKTEAGKIMKYENLVLEIKTIWKPS